MIAISSLKAPAALACLSLLLLTGCNIDVLGKKARGNWQGIASEINGDGTEQEYPITIIINDDEHIAVDYPSFNCSSTLERLPSYDGHAEFRENIIETESGCPNSGLTTLVMSESDNSQLSWRWKLRNENDELVYATATLNRVPPAEPKDVNYFRNQNK